LAEKLYGGGNYSGDQKKKNIAIGATENQCQKKRTGFRGDPIKRPGSKVQVLHL